MGNSDYSEAEKHIFLGLLLKKRRPKKLDKRILGITHSQESLERKIEMMLELDEIHKRVKDVKEEEQKHGKEKKQVRRRGRRKKKPNIFVIDPSGDIYNLLQSSLLRKRVLFRKLGDSANDIDLINEVKPDLLIINQTLSLRHFALEINQLLKPNIPLIILSWEQAQDFYGGSTRRVIRVIQKPLNVTIFEQAIRELTG